MREEYRNIKSKLLSNSFNSVVAIHFCNNMWIAELIDESTEEVIVSGRGATIENALYSLDQNIFFERS